VYFLNLYYLIERHHHLNHQVIHYFQVKGSTHHLCHHLLMLYLKKLKLRQDFLADQQLE